MLHWLSTTWYFGTPVLPITEQTVSLCLNSSSERRLCFHSCCFIHYICFMFVDVLYLLLCTWTLYFSLSSLLYHPIHVGDCSCKTLVINRDFWYAYSSKRWPEWLLALVSLWKLARCACFFLCVCFDNKSVFLLSTFSQSGYLLSAVSHTLVCLCIPFFLMLCLLAFPNNCIKWCTRYPDDPAL